MYVRIRLPTLTLTIAQVNYSFYYNQTLNRDFDEVFAWSAGLPATIIIFLTILGNSLVLLMKAQV